MKNTSLSFNDFMHWLTIFELSNFEELIFHLSQYQIFHSS